jgi:hypothetical protein
MTRILRKQKAKFHEKWLKENKLSKEDISIRDEMESLNSALARLCATCKNRETKLKSVYNTVSGFKDIEILGCLNELDPRTSDGKDCPYYMADLEALAEITLNRIADSKAAEEIKE